MQRERRRVLHIHHLQVVVSLVVRLLPQHNLQETLDSQKSERTNLDGHDVFARRVDVADLFPASHLRQSIDLQNIVANIGNGVLLLETGGENGRKEAYYAACRSLSSCRRARRFVIVLYRE